MLLIQPLLPCLAKWLERTGLNNESTRVLLPCVRTSWFIPQLWLMMSPTLSVQLWDLFVCLFVYSSSFSVTQLMWREQESFVIPCSSFKYIHLFDTNAVVYLNKTHKNKDPSLEAFAYSVSEKELPDIPCIYLSSFNLNLNFGSKISECSSLPESEALNPDLEEKVSWSCCCPLVEALLRYFHIQERMPALYSNYFKIFLSLILQIY